MAKKRKPKQKKPVERSAWVRIARWPQAAANFIRENKLFTLMLALFFVAGLLLGFARYRTYLDGFDYAIFTQAIWQYSQFDLPRSSIRDIGLLWGDHFHPLLVILAPLFWIWNDPLALTVVQPAAFALSAIPLYLLSKKHLGRTSALLISGAYLISHGLQYALFFDFHEIALAVPLVSLLIYSIDLERYRLAIASAVLLCLVREELVLLVAMAGLVIILKNRRYKLGAIIFGGAMAFFMLLIKFLMPALAGQGRYYTYWTYDLHGANVSGVAKNFLSQPIDFLQKVYNDVNGNETKRNTFKLFVLASGFSVFFSWYALLALPNLGIRLLSQSGTYYWSYWFHYGAILMPIIFFCFIDVLRKLQNRFPVSVWPPVIAVLCGLLFLVNLNVMIDKNFPFAQILNPEFYNLNSQVRKGEEKVKEVVGPTSSITAPVIITPHFANRSEIYVLTDKGRWYQDEKILRTKKPETDFVILNTKLPLTDVYPYYKYADLQRDITDIGYRLHYQDPDTGWMVYKK